MSHHDSTIYHQKFMLAHLGEITRPKLSRASVWGYTVSIATFLTPAPPCILFPIATDGLRPGPHLPAKLRE